MARKVATGHEHRPLGRRRPLDFRYAMLEVFGGAIGCYAQQARNAPCKLSCALDAQMAAPYIAAIVVGPTAARGRPSAPASAGL